ncbi:putative acyl-CoA desaturase [Helianthus annuus]|nr:putative acyl-CoA desaturase [Helianthus annuus]KAJ0884422.1 putative acyl-CoA desaturase [Helianthus annuus]
MLLNAANESEHERIIFSDVMITRKRNLFWGRKWRTLDVRMASGIFSLHVLALFAPSTFSWDAFRYAILFYFLTGMLGVTMCYHRVLAHHSLKLPKWLEYTCAYLGRDPIYWVSIHRYHHQYVDSEKDPHTPTYGFWFSHMGWLFDSGYIMEKGVRTTLVYHMTFLVNSACHIWGNRAWNTNDLSRNNWWVAMVTFGEGWHNNHHAFEYSARHGLEWWQIDLTWYLICFLKSVRLATSVKLPTQAQKLKKSIACDSKLK